MRILDIFRNTFQAQQERDLLTNLTRRLSRIENADEYRDALCAAIVEEACDLSTGNPALIRSALSLCHALLAYEGHLHIPTVDTQKPLSMSEAWKLKAAMTAALAPFENPPIAELLREALTSFLRALLPDMSRLPETTEGATPLAVPLYTLLPDPASVVQRVMQLPYRDDLIRSSLFERLRVQFYTNTCLASGIDPERAEKSAKALVFPTTSDLSASELIAAYLAGTPFLDFFVTPLPFSIPFPVRFEHTHIVGGSGHGKTQLLQHLILRDLKKLQEGRGSVIVIDSQGDMLRTITKLAQLSPTHPESLADRLVLIDPNDVEHPPALTARFESQ